MKTAALCALLALFVLGAWASSHSESPNTADSPVSDWSDLYAFRSYEAGRSDFVTVLANLYPMQSPFGGPNYYTISDQFFYEIYFDLNGDCFEDLTLRWTFGSQMGGDIGSFNVEPNDRDCNTSDATTQNIHGGVELPIGTGTNQKNVAVPLKFVGPISAGDNSALNWIEYYTVDAIVGSRDGGTVFRLPSTNGNSTYIKPFDYAGTKTFSDYDAYANQYIYDVDLSQLECATNGKVFVGQRADPFYISLGKIFDLVNLIPIPGFPGAVTEDAANNDLKNKNVHTIAIEFPYACLNDTFGVWLGTRRLFHNTNGDHIAGPQVSRLGNPLVNELVIGLPDKANYSHSVPSDDLQFGVYVAYPTLPEIVSLLYLDAVNLVLGSNLTSLAPKNLPRNDLITAFLLGIPGLTNFSSAPCDILRVNAAGVAPQDAASQSPFGVIQADLGGFPNGRRPGDDVVDIALRVIMGRLCVLGLTCNATDAPVGKVDFTDGAPVAATDFQSVFPYFNTPYPGAVNEFPDSCGGNPASTISSFMFEGVRSLMRLLGVNDEAPSVPSEKTY